MNLNCTLPPGLATKLCPSTGEALRVRYCLKSDLDLDRTYGDSYLAVTDAQLHVLSDKDVVLSLKLSDIREVKVDELFGSSRLVAQTEQGDVALIYYTKACMPEFGVLSRVVSQIIKGIEPEIPDEHEHAYCPRCGAPLPERGATCDLCVPKWTVFRRLLGLVAPFRMRAILLVVATCAAVASQMIPPYITKRIVDDVIRGGKYNQLAMWIALMLASALLLLLARLCSEVLSSWLSARLVADLRARLHETVQRLRLAYFHKRGSGELVSRIMHDTGELQHFLVDGLPYLMVNSISIVAIAAILLSLDALLALLVFFPVPFLIFGAEIFWNRLHPLFHRRGSKIGALHTILSESISGIKVIKAFAQERRRVSRFNLQNEKLFGIRFNIEATWIGFERIMFFIMQLGVTAVWFFAARRLSRNDPTLTLGDLLAFVGYIWLLYGPLQWFTAVLNWMTHAFASAERIFQVIDTQPEVYEAPNAVAIPKIQGRIAFDDVRFSYERGKEVIKGISFEIEPGEMIGLVGRSGVGKSTIINLICRFYDVDSGLIQIDGHPIKQISLRDLRGQLGMVMQDSFLFNASIIDNIRYAKPEASFEQVVRAAQAAFAHDFILDKEDGYDTVIGEKGIELSGGEKQRLSIARAILHDPPILILDEATSSVDSETEKNIQEAIAELIRGRTTIAIAHRLSTLRNANRLFYLEDGKILEMGTHDELVAADGKFAGLVRMQTELNQIRGEAWKE